MSVDLKSEDVELMLDSALIQFYGVDGKPVGDWSIDALKREVERIVRSSPLSVGLDTCDDIIQEVWIKILDGRRKFRFRGKPQWISYVSKIVLSCCVDWFRQNKAQQELKEEDVTFELILNSNYSIIDATAGEVWLGYPAHMPLKERKRRLLAAQLFYLENQPWEIICSIVQPKIDRETLDSWLQDEATLKDLAYHEIYLSGPRLVKHLLKLAKEPDLAQLFMEARDRDHDEPGMGSWTWGEILAIIWRFGFGYPRQRVYQRLGVTMSEEALEAHFVRCGSLLEFNECMVCLQESLGTHCRKVLSHKGIWRRLAFEYRYKDELELEDIFERMSSQAEFSGFHLTVGSLNMWLSGRRLLMELQSRLEGMGLEDE